ncbi:hypothetical protein ACVDG3_18215 [Meridianimarinicoccus sp. RP-17]|uniref:hypothetical protein n=1 Tax=Meridianimarinicoccus zhengii TaxID=2056810 RepID=UPI000DAB972E|nr:hypothetical protein [Phycocomes zhengii]
MSKRHDDWRDAAALIDQQIDGDRDALLRVLTDRFGLTVTQRGNVTRARGLGITANATSGDRMALVNWSNAARRRLIREGV